MPWASSIVNLFFPEEDSYGLLSIMASSKRSKYLYMSKNDIDVACMTALELTKKFARKHFIYLEVMSTDEELKNLFDNWLFWIFHYLPFPHVVRHVLLKGRLFCDIPYLGRHSAFLFH